MSKNKKKKACFYATGISSNSSVEQYYQQDIDILNELGYEVVIASKFSEIPFFCDLYFSWWASGAFFPLLVSKFSRAKLIVVAGGNECQLVSDSVTNEKYGYLSYGWLKRLLVRFVLLASDRVIAVSNYMVRDISIISKYKCNPIVVYNSVNTQRFRPSEVSQRKYITIICSTNSSAYKLKRLGNFIKSASLVVDKYPEQIFMVVGRKGDYHDLYMSEIHKYKLEKNFIFKSDVPNEQIPLIFSETKLYCQISDVETFGVAVCEAIACGLPVLVSARGALPEVVGDYGIYCDHNSCDDIARKILDTIENVATREFILYSNDRYHYILNKFSYRNRFDSVKKIIYEM